MPAMVPDITHNFDNMHIEKHQHITPTNPVTIDEIEYEHGDDVPRNTTLCLVQEQDQISSRVKNLPDKEELENGYSPRETAVFVDPNQAKIWSQSAFQSNDSIEGICDDMEADRYLASSDAQPTSPGQTRQTVVALERANVQGRDSLLNYRPSDMKETRRSSMYRDSLITGRQSDMRDLLTELDSNYRMSVNTADEAVKNLSPLLKAARGGDLAEVVALIEKPNTDILRRDAQHGQTALHFAVRGGHINIVKALLAPNIVRSIIDVPDNRRNTALHLSAAKSRRITKLILENGAEVNTYNMRNQTPLGVHILTTKKDDPLMAEMLLQHKADPNSPVDQSTLLHIAIDRQLIEIACRLVRHGARMDMKDENGKMVFDKLNRKVLRKLISKISFPPVWVPNEERSNCMLCSKKFSKIIIGVRRHHCRHCGRICCGECSHLAVECVRFPEAFNDRLKPGAKANTAQRRVCKTCYGVFKERSGGESKDEKEGKGAEFLKRVVNYTWDEMPGQHNNAGGKA